MNTIHNGAEKRLVLSPRYGAAKHDTTTNKLPVAGMLSTMELRRLVATMVD